MDQERSDVENFDGGDPVKLTVDSKDDENFVSGTDDRELTASNNNPSKLETDGDDQLQETEQIKDQIEATRTQMGETIDAIQDRLSFSNLSEQVSDHVTNAVETAKDAVYDATIGKAAGIMKTFSEEISKTSIVQTVKNNPFPFILIGAGAGLLAYQSYGGQGKSSSRRREFRQETGGIHTDSYSSPADLKSDLGGVTDTVASAAGTAYNKVSGVVGSAYTGAGEVAGQAYDKVGDLGMAAKDKYAYYIEENPLAVGAVALALGAAVGMAIPATRYEGELMGQARQDLMGKVQTTASDLLDKTKQVGADAVAAVTEQVQSATSS